MPKNVDTRGDLKAPQPTWYLYVLRRTDGALYTGITLNVSRRLDQHRSGRGAKALRGRGDLRLCYEVLVGDRSQALRAEYRFKQLSKSRKEGLVKQAPGGAALLQILSL